MPMLTVAGGLMILVNIGFLVGGIMVLHFNKTLKSSGWGDALEGTDYESYIGTAHLILQLLGIAAIVLAVVGIVGAVIQNRLLLLLYSIVMVITMSAFGAVAGTAFAFNSKMTDWRDKAFPAEEQENKVARTFNEIYCYAEGYYYCNDATAKEAYEIFAPGAPAALVSLLPNVTGIVSLCGELSGAVEGFDKVCEACNMSAKYTRYEKVLTWAEDKCPRTSATGVWCVSFLSTGTAGEVYNGSPYGQCRAIFLGVAVDWSNTIAIAGLLVAIAAVAIVFMACFARRSKSEDYNRSLQ